MLINRSLDDTHREDSGLKLIKRELIEIVLDFLDIYSDECIFRWMKILSTNLLKKVKKGSRLVLLGKHVSPSIFDFLQKLFDLYISICFSKC